MSKDIPFATFQDLCRRSGLAATHQRYTIFQAVVALGDNPTPEEVFAHVRQTLPGISLATVYKNIDIFVAHLMLRDISPNYGSRRIESASRPHDHFVCRVCRRVFDLKKHTRLGPPRPAELPRGASFEHHLVEYVGICAPCARRLKRGTGKINSHAPV